MYIIFKFSFIKEQILLCVSRQVAELIRQSLSDFCGIVLVPEVGIVNLFYPGIDGENVFSPETEQQYAIRNFRSDAFERHKFLPCLVGRKSLKTVKVKTIFHRARRFDDIRGAIPEPCLEVIIGVFSDNAFAVGNALKPSHLSPRAVDSLSIIDFMRGMWLFAEIMKLIKVSNGSC